MSGLDMDYIKIVKAVWSLGETGDKTAHPQLERYCFDHRPCLELNRTVAEVVEEAIMKIMAKSPEQPKVEKVDAAVEKIKRRMEDLREQGSG